MAEEKNMNRRILQVLKKVNPDFCPHPKTKVQFLKITKMQEIAGSAWYQKR